MCHSPYPFLNLKTVDFCLRPLAFFPFLLHMLGPSSSAEVALEKLENLISF